MALRVAAKARVTISQDNAAQPQELTFDSGDKSLIDAALYQESAGYTFKVAPAAVDQQVDLGSLAEVDVLYLFAKSAGLLIKIVPVGKVLAEVEAYEIVANAPAIIPFRLASIYVSNPTVADIVLVFGAAGN